ncbi:MAG TPA: CbiX/SirB N-terminal domain-containing protein, partial [Mycobacteriales bacterium]|nr:CbiX/SirB N-terminal domain-containing protein [Mycobacteriales bacterium]
MTAPRLLAVAHGSREERSVPPLEALLERVRGLLPEPAVELAFVDHRSPSITAALRDSAPTVVVPLLLSSASHVKGDIAAAVRSAGPAVLQARPLVPHIGVIRAVADRLEQAGAGADTAVVLAAIGAADPAANAQVVAEARRVWEWRGGGDPVEAAFAS